ncbi:acetyl-CoA hydrolase/transferase family protein [Rhodococcus opacus]|uniref:Putative CoA-transferase n=1 Tax=Rhodococcus opacus (strain B4) TaxID=632772 RepID=C1B5D3_RHOOB|nr:acetyl-CoA hydrolase/transferase C-terminal domain-containing protein [Rhodococcus opacus]BAH51059.1 putative CoA-transferase [Rhodococcus opacus B4]
MPDFPISEFLRPGDLVAIGEATAEPRTLVARFLDAARDIDDLTALCGYALDDIWHSVPDGHPTVMSYAAHGSLRKLAATGQLQILPCHLSSLVRFIRNGTLPVDVVLLQLPPADAEGFHSLGGTVGYLVDALDSARVVLAEINPNMPRTNSSRRIHQSQITATVTSDIPLPGSPTRPATEVDRTIAANVATLIPDGASLQLGVGAIPAEITKVIRERSGLRIRSNLIGDWIFDLVDSGAVDISVAGSCTTGMALGSRRLYDFVDSNTGIDFVHLDELLAPATLASCDPFVVVNSALQVDLLGQVNAESLGDLYVGAVGGQVDSFRATRMAKSGLSVIALPATNPAGDKSSIVAQLTGPTTSLQSDVDIIATEYGVADLRATTAAQRAARLVAVAAPAHRDQLRTELTGGHRTER